MAAVKAAEGMAGIGEVELHLLLAKTYSQWRGHIPEALAVYDAIIKVMVLSVHCSNDVLVETVASITWQQRSAKP